jgi:hypothetical protein
MASELCSKSQHLRYLNKSVSIPPFVSFIAVVQLTDTYPLARILWTVLLPDRAHCCTGVQPASPCAVLPVVLRHRNKLRAPGFPYTTRQYPVKIQSLPLALIAFGPHNTFSCLYDKEIGEWKHSKILCCN